MHCCNEPLESYNFTKICQIFISKMSTISDLTSHIMIPGAGSLAPFGLTGSRCSQATRLAASPLDFALAARPRALVLQLSLLAGYFVALSGFLSALSCGENQEERIIKKNLRDPGIDCFACCMSLFGLVQHKT